MCQDGEPLINAGFFVPTAQCTVPLGMESGEIKDSDLTASSSFDTGNVGPQNAR